MTLDDMMNCFRLASRSTFNNYFHICKSSQNNGLIFEERFSEVEKLLFQKLVTEPLSLQNIMYGKTQTEIGVELSVGDFAPIMINREIKSGYWDYPLEEITKDAEMVFVQFFDWSQLDYRDNRYVRVLIRNWPSHPEVNGKHALIESFNVRFVSLSQEK